MDKQLKRIKELEALAKQRFLENSDWDDILDMLDPEEREEYDAPYELKGVNK